MDTIQIVGFAASILVGITLGLTGGGGSILTVPILVYLFHINPVISTAYSLFVVGTTSLVGGVRFMRQGLVNYQAAVLYGIPSIVAVYLTRRFLVPAIPDPAFTFGSWEVPKDLSIMVLFGIVMLAAAVSMITKKSSKDEVEGGAVAYHWVALEGIFVGLVTGIVGAGGGFLIVPALVMMVHLPMRIAVGTSLVIIAFNSLIGFLGDIGQHTIDWAFLSIFAILSIAGIFMGTYLAQKVSGAQLKKGFGWFVLAMGIFIISTELMR